MIPTLTTLNGYDLLLLSHTEKQTVGAGVTFPANS